MTTPSNSRFHLVVGVDDSKASDAAVRFAASVAGQHENATVTLVFVEKPRRPCLLVRGMASVEEALGLCYPASGFHGYGGPDEVGGQD